MLGWVQTRCLTSFPAGERGPRLRSSSNWQLIPSHIRRSQAGAAGSLRSAGVSSRQGSGPRKPCLPRGHAGWDGAWGSRPQPALSHLGKKFLSTFDFCFHLVSVLWTLVGWGHEHPPRLTLTPPEQQHISPAPSSFLTKASGKFRWWWLDAALSLLTHGFGDD